MANKPPHVIYNEDCIDEDGNGKWIFNSKYDEKNMKTRLKNHFEDGGQAINSVLAGVCGVSKQTIGRWRDPDSLYYKSAFDKWIQEHECKASALTDKWHRQSARGDLKDANAHTLNRRAEKLAGMGETKKIIQEQAITFRDLDEIQAAIEQAEEECDAEEI